MLRKQLSELWINLDAKALCQPDNLSLSTSDIIYLLILQFSF